MNEQKAPFEAQNMSEEAVRTEFMERTLALQLAWLAVDLARQAGEEVTRPLSQEQLARALQVNSQETGHLTQLLNARWERLYLEGRLSDQAYLQSSAGGSGLES